MTITRLFQYAVILVGAAWLGYALIRGFRRRRSYWPRRSWLAFGATCAVALLVLAAAMVLGEVIASGTFASQPNLKGFLIIGVLALLVAGAGLLALVVSWFALGKPQGAFPTAFRARLRQALFAAPPNEELKPTAAQSNLVE